MKYRNSVIYSNRDSKFSLTNSCNDKMLKNLFLNNLNKISKNNIDLIKNLNNTFRNYQLNLNQKDIKIANNLFNISTNRVINIRNKIKKSEKLFHQYEEQYGFNSAINMSKIINNNSNPCLLNESKVKDDFFRNLIHINKNRNKNNDKNAIIEEYNSKKYNFRRYSANVNYKNDMKQKFMKLIINEKKIQKKIRKIDQLNTLFSAIETIEKKEIINGNKFFKVENKKRELLSFFKDLKKDKKLFNYNYIRNRHKQRKNKNKNCLSEEKSIIRENISKFSHIKSENNIKDYNNKTLFNLKINKNNDNKKVIPQIFLSTSNSKSNLSNIKNSKIENLSDISNIESTSKNKKNIIFSSSFPNLNHLSKNTNIKRNINYSLYNISHIEK